MVFQSMEGVKTCIFRSIIYSKFTFMVYFFLKQT